MCLISTVCLFSTVSQLLGIGDEELYRILNRDLLFAEPCSLASEGDMYDIIAINDGGGILGQLE